MKNFFLRDKRKESLRLDGFTVLLDEIRPEYFPYVIMWRNDKNLNRYINQPEELTHEKELIWYENIYLRDNSQGFMIMIDKKSMTPFATLGWTNYDPEKRQCIRGRLMLCNPCYALKLMEGTLILSDYLYEFVDVIYSHISITNKKSLQWSSLMGFELTSGEWEYPSEKKVNGLDMCEKFLTFGKYQEVRAELIRKFHIVLDEKYVKYTMTKSESPSITDLRLTTHDIIYALILIKQRYIEKLFPVRIFRTGNFCIFLHWRRRKCSR